MLKTPRLFPWIFWPLRMNSVWDRREEAWFLIDRDNCAVAMTAREARTLGEIRFGTVLPIVPSAPKAPKTGTVNPRIAYTLNCHQGGGDIHLRLFCRYFSVLDIKGPPTT
jgi:hypothetical protein